MNNFLHLKFDGSVSEAKDELVNLLIDSPIEKYTNYILNGGTINNPAMSCNRGDPVKTVEGYLFELASPIVNELGEYDFGAGVDMLTVEEARAVAKPEIDEGV